jgi:mRNA-degrading endonuclease toxin of MazEF toxin-antitoxin module
MTSSAGGIGRGAVCWATVPAGFGHDQGARPWLILSPRRMNLARVVAVPISSESPDFGYPLSWPVPARWGLERPSWVRVDHVRSLPVARLRDPFAETSRDELEEVVDAVGELLGATISAR